MTAAALWRRSAGLRLGLGGLGTLALAWWWATAGAHGTSVLAARFSPGATLSSLAGLLQQPDFFQHAWASLRRVLAALAIALLAGVPAGLLVGGLQRVDAALSPAFQFLRMVSPLSWMPIVVMVLGVGDRSVLFLLAFAGVWPILLNTAAGVRQLDPRWLLLARSLAATRAELLCRVILPGVLSHVLTGLRLSIGVVWIVLVPAEMLGIDAGLGYFILDTRDRLAYSELLATVLVIGALGFALDGAARRLQRWWVPGQGPAP
ncbi:ABC transporter permease [Cupriavidus sp. USMAHM13]|uniref:ABC transporter permease n=1 Tax=Cupriavidus sp. USMAHM13 TaxID=1389192 RepID=UPI0009F6F676|nr:ABC transporter permease [Cupriavidus sp. USMAHM13]